MSADLKPLFRPQALKPKLATFTPSAQAVAARSKLKDWADLLSSEQGKKFKEREILPTFLIDVFVTLLGYTGPAAGGTQYTMSHEKHVQVDGKFADAVLGAFTANESQILVAVEGKGPLDPLDRPHAGRKMSAVDQGYRYAINLPCDWIIVTNMREIRLYHKGSDQHTCDSYSIADLVEDDALFQRFVFVLGAERVVSAEGKCHLKDLLGESERIGKELTREYYGEYAGLRVEFFRKLCESNPKEQPGAILTATQKLLDRVLFCSFCEDRGLLPAETIASAYRHSDLYNPRPVWDNFRGLFRSIDQGNAALKIPQYNGGLFAPDDLLERISVPDALCAGLAKLAAYDYSSTVRPAGAKEDKADGKVIDVDILGHIFEQSISDLERMRNQLEGRQVEEETKSRRKKEGAFYTPAFITRYIVSQTLGPVLADRFEDLRKRHEAAAKGAVKHTLATPKEYETGKLSKAQKAALIRFWEDWQEELGSVRVLDPACGSGAFLIEAFDQLHAAYQLSNDRLLDLRGNRSLFDLDRHILQNNLYGVDINDEAVEICRLSLWIKTAQYGKVLTSLDHTIRVGNSVVDDPAVHPKAFDWRGAFPEVFEAAGFDAVIGNPPYVRQEWISDIKPHLQKRFQTFDGAADLYVYFYELGLGLLRPGGRLSFVVTNKWMKAGYGEPLRRLFAEQAWMESVVDFGHAKQIFVDADVFPSIIVARKPTEQPAPSLMRACAIPRELLRIDDLTEQIRVEGIELPRGRLTAEPWNLEASGVSDLLAKIQNAGVALKDFAGVKPFRGIVTGFNDAFLIDGATRNSLIAEDPRSGDIIRPYLRGQDVDRWVPQWAGLWMIFARRGIDIDQYPAIKKHLAQFQVQLEPKPQDWKDGHWPGRKSGTYKWFEVQDPIDYWREFEKPKIVYQEIQFHPRYAMDRVGMLSNNKVFFVTCEDFYLLGVLNSPLMWWHNWRYLPHMKDEALSPAGFLMESLPIAEPTGKTRASISSAVQRLLDIAEEQNERRAQVLDWLRLEYEISKPTQKLGELLSLDEDAFLTEVKKARGKLKALSVEAVKGLRSAHAKSVEPVRRLGVEAMKLEGSINDLVNAAYGLTPDEIALMWKTAPPRMPLIGAGLAERAQFARLAMQEKSGTE